MNINGRQTTKNISRRLQSKRAQTSQVASANCMTFFTVQFCGVQRFEAMELDDWDGFGSGVFLKYILLVGLGIFTACKQYI